MKYFVPKIKAAEVFNSQPALVEKLGGLPFGLRAEMYPVCRKCGNPMALLAQFLHHGERLDLGRAGRVLFVFQCNHRGSFFSACPTWEIDSGANACFVAEPENLTGRVEELPGGEVELNKEFWVAGWEAADDRIAEEDAVYFFNRGEFDNIDEELAEELFDKNSDATKLGGLPAWIQYPEIPEGKWRFAGQLDDRTGFNFGDAGIGYIFIEESENSERPPRGRFFTQCS